MTTRRDFLRLLTATASVLTLDPLQGVSVSSRSYSNARLGLSVSLPKGWEFSSIADFAALRERQVLQNVFDHLPEEPHPLQDPQNLPVFLFEHPDHRDGHFVPAIALYDEELKQSAPSDELFAHSRFLKGLSLSYPGFNMERAPTAIDLHGTGATLSKFSYLHEIDSGESHSLDIGALLIFRPPRVLTFYLVDSNIDPKIPQNQWTDFIDSIVI